MMKKELICIVCPRSCHLTAETAADEWNISGNMCPRGRRYALQELSDPRRVVTAVVPCRNSKRSFVPVRTDQPFPKMQIASLLNRLYKMSVSAPLKCGDIVWENVDGSGINVVATESREAGKDGAK